MPDHATVAMDIPDARGKQLQQASHIQHAQSTKPCVPTKIPAKAKANLKSNKDKRQIAFLPTPLAVAPCLLSPEHDGVRGLIQIQKILRSTKAYYTTWS
jgi:hypothetical protein